MKQLREKSEIRFAVGWIIAYCVLMSVGDSISEALGIAKIVTMPLCFAMAAVLFLFLKKNELCGEYGLCKPRATAGSVLFYLPFVVLASVNLWFGVTLRMSAVELVLYLCSMLLVGFLEEVIFRGLLFKAMSRDNFKSAVVVSALTFGAGHVVNLLNGSGASLLSTGLQVVYAIAIGFACVAVFVRTGSLVPCIVMHGVLNALSAFAPEIAPAQEILASVVLTIVALSYAFYLFRGQKQ